MDANYYASEDNSDDDNDDVGLIRVAKQTRAPNFILKGFATENDGE